MKCDKEKGGCGYVYEIDEEKVKGDKSIQCPCCARISSNPLYDEDYDKQGKSYIG
jgi:hypothetical protein